MIAQILMFLVLVGVGLPLFAIAAVGIRQVIESPDDDYPA